MGTAGIQTTALAALRIGAHQVRGHVVLAPMSGITDPPFRSLAQAEGAGLVVSEMVASEHLLKDRHGARRRTEANGLSPRVIQIAGCDAHWMAEGDRVAVVFVAVMIDIA